jgi:multidrug efflux pump subunit AcrB
VIVTDWSVKNRVVVLVACLAFVIGGVVAYVFLPLEAFPEVEIPFVMVNTGYRGVSPTDVERSITVKIEEELKGLTDVRKLTSTSSEGNSNIVVEFEPEVDMDEALRKVKDRVDRAKGELPSDLENDPTVFEISPSDFPVVTVVLSGPVGLPALKRIAEDYKAEFETIPQVVEAEISGGLEREIIVGVDNDRAIGYGLPTTQVMARITAENQSISGGAIPMGPGRYQLRVPGEFATPAEARKIVVAVIDGEPVYLDDVAEIRDSFKDETSRSRIDHVAAVMIGVKKRSGGNVVKLVEEIDEIMAEQKDKLPGGVTAVKVNDLAKFVKWLVKDLENNLASGFILVLLVVFFAMGFRNALLVSVSIPLSMLISFIVIDALGLTLNMIVLFSMILALGMLVDNAIVIIENIYRFMQAGVPRVRAACRATAEVAWPILGSSLTTIAAFTPLLFWPGIMGSIMSNLPKTVIVTLLACLAVALVVNPALAAFFMKRPAGAKTLSAEEVEKAGERPTEADTPVLRYYRGALRWLLAGPSRRFAVLAGAFLTLVLCVFIWAHAVGIRTPMGFMPAIDPDTVHIVVETPEGAGLDYNDAVARAIERRLKGAGADGSAPSDIGDIDHVIAKASLREGFGFGPGMGAANLVTVSFIDMEARERSSRDTANELRRRKEGIPGAEITVEEEEKGPPIGKPINIEISGADMEVLGGIAAEIRAMLEEFPFATDIQDDYATGVPTLRVRVDRKKAALVGLSTEEVGFALKTAFNGFKVSAYREQGEDYDIVVRLRDADRNTIGTLERFFIPTRTGELVPLTTIAEIVYEGGYAAITRIGFERTVTVRANVDLKTITGDTARKRAEEKLAELAKKDAKFERLRDLGYRIRFTGEFEFQKEAQEFLLKAALIAIFLIAIILVSIFNSVSQPLIIMTSVVLSTGAAFLGLAVARLPFILVMSGIGLISLGGVVVNNAIVLVDYTNKLRDRGYSLDDAVVAAGQTRLRPVILTAVTTILGLVPLVTGIAFDFREFAFARASESSQWWTPMAICVIFGLGVATALTLVVVPCLYHAIESAKARAGLTSTGDDTEAACRT